MTQIKVFPQTKGKGLSLLLAMAVGMLIPQAHGLSFLIQYLLMVMLFFAFLDINFRPQAFQKSVLRVLIANVAIAFVSYAALAPINPILALSTFMTAIAAPVIIGFIKGEVEYVIAAVLLTNIANAIDNFILPHDQRPLNELDGGAIHFCGKGDHFSAPLLPYRVCTA